jgi:hypothetical protein
MARINLKLIHTRNETKGRTEGEKEEDRKKKKKKEENVTGYGLRDFLFYLNF